MSRSLMTILRESLNSQFTVSIENIRRVVKSPQIMRSANNVVLPNSNASVTFPDVQTVSCHFLFPRLLFL